MEIEVASRAECGGDDMEKGVVGLNGGDERGMYLVWEDLRVVVPNFGNGHTKKLINGLTGFAEPGRIIVIMGPSGSGKSTLLHSLSAGFVYSLLLLCSTAEVCFVALGCTHDYPYSSLPT
ncbi:hypothetical protein TEA_017942 [Camellia sinensis var. sinensis]|uniref:ABC transporter domain-containing protein n=1 Tax=Camellia sinensis var. sinensis TaxID=542762 RepID=A0A4S4E0I9_CAMSN|nr:hypothetical protein TEA_017942 [Camellia sinensis var. sinensis]